jgi:hypothetical protein
VNALQGFTNAEIEMLADHLTIGMKLYGLRQYLMGTPDATAGAYRVVNEMGLRYIQFSAERVEGRSNIIMLPYRPGQIKTTPMQGEEVISGEFTGCIMTMFNDDGVRMCGHVCTQEGYTRRADWDEIKGSGVYTDVVERDTVGLVANLAGATLNTSILCVAESATGLIRHVYVERAQENEFQRGAMVTTQVYRVIQVGEGA